MTLNEFILNNTKLLSEAGIETARLDCLVLLSDELQKNKAWILSHSDDNLQGSVLKNLSTKVAQRALHTPLAYIRGIAEFYGREFTVSDRTLVPRPETEAMIELVKVVRNMESDVAAWQVERRGRKPHKKQYLFEKAESSSNIVKTPDGYKVVWQKQKRTPFTQAPTVHGQSLSYHDEDLCMIDIGTGSGAIAVTAKCEIPEATVLATDIDEDCLRVAKENATRHGADITFLHGNLFQPIAKRVPADATIILLCNLPYVPDGYPINTAATHEPRLALFGGPDGLDPYRELFQQITDAHIKPEYILTESLPSQHEQLKSIAADSAYRLERTTDLIQLFIAAD
jgi:release factor glutamine methyltransferase